MAIPALIYRDQVIAVGTRHGKQHQFARAFRQELQAALVTPPDLDTDQFGTFTGEVRRRGTAIAAASAKARLAMQVTGLPFGLASEASYGPLAGGWPGHEEILLFCDDRLGIEVLEGCRSVFVPGGSHRVAGPDDLPDPVLAGLPDQALTVRTSSFQPDGWVKGITDVVKLASAITEAAARSPDGLALVEPDLRAHHNPSRRRVLEQLSVKMVRRLATHCPACQSPGFGRVDTETGLPCKACGTATPLMRNEIQGCVTCSHLVSAPIVGGADPGSCPMCNP